jgi:hypothetical protein
LRDTNVQTAILQATTGSRARQPRSVEGGWILKQPDGRLTVQRWLHHKLPDGSLGELIITKPPRHAVAHFAISPGKDVMVHVDERFPLIANYPLGESFMVDHKESAYRVGYILEDGITLDGQSVTRVVRVEYDSKKKAVSFYFNGPENEPTTPQRTP